MVDANRKSKLEEAKTEDIPKSTDEDIEEIFSNSLESKQAPVLAKQHTDDLAVAKATFYEKIEEDASGEDNKSGEGSEGDDPEEKQIKEQLQRRQMYKSRVLLGIDEDDQVDASVEFHKRQKVLVQRQQENRKSLSQQFFQRKLGVSSEQNLFRGQNPADLAQIQNQYLQNKMKVEDLFLEDDDEPITQQASKVLQQSQSQFLGRQPVLYGQKI